MEAKQLGSKAKHVGKRRSLLADTAVRARKPKKLANQCSTHAHARTHTHTRKLHPPSLGTQIPDCGSLNKNQAGACIAAMERQVRRDLQHLQVWTLAPSAQWWKPKALLALFCQTHRAKNCVNGRFVGRDVYQGNKERKQLHCHSSGSPDALWEM